MKAFFTRLATWLIGARAAAPAAERIEPKAEARKAEPWLSTNRLREALAFLIGASKRPAASTSVSYRTHSFKLPKPLPGVVPANGAEMAADSQISAVVNFGSAETWDGHGFMGYAMLSELAQIPEFRRPSEILANEMTRKWVKIISTGDDDKTETIKVIEDELKRIGAQEAFRRAFELDNFFGIGHILPDFGITNDAELKTPLLLDAKIARDSLKGLIVIEPVWTYPNNYNSTNPLKADFYRPQTWFALSIEIHTSRLLTVVSRPVPDMLKPAYQFGGVSLTQLLHPYVQNWLRTRQSVSDITHNFSTSVLKTDMGAMMAPGGAEQMALRGQVFATARDNLGLMLLDMDKEDFVDVSAPIAGLDKLQAQAQEQMAAVPGIPLVKFFGITPAGLNASSDGEIRCFYDGIESAQERVGTPNMRVLLDIIQMSKFGVIDPAIGFKWEPLWSLDEKALGDVRKTNAETDQILIDSGVIRPEEARATVAAEEDSRYASIEVDDVPDLAAEEEDGLEPAGGKGGGKSGAAGAGETDDGAREAA